LLQNILYKLSLMCPKKYHMWSRYFKDKNNR